MMSALVAGAVETHTSQTANLQAAGDAGSAWRRAPIRDAAPRVPTAAGDAQRRLLLLLQVLLRRRLLSRVPPRVPHRPWRQAAARHAAHAAHAAGASHERRPHACASAVMQSHTSRSTLGPQARCYSNTMAVDTAPTPRLQGVMAC